MTKEKILSILESAKDKNGAIPMSLVRKAFEKLPSAQPERPEQPEYAREYCAECGHIEMCRWYPFEGCEFRSIQKGKDDEVYSDI